MIDRSLYGDVEASPPDPHELNPGLGENEKQGVSGAWAFQTEPQDLFPYRVFKPGINPFGQ